MNLDAVVETGRYEQRLSSNPLEAADTLIMRTPKGVQYPSTLTEVPNGY